MLCVVDVKIDYALVISGYLLTEVYCLLLAGLRLVRRYASDITLLSVTCSYVFCELPRTGGRGC